MGEGMVLRAGSVQIKATPFITFCRRMIFYEIGLSRVESMR